MIRRGMGNKLTAYIVPAMLVIFAPVLVSAGPVGLPDSARPGAVRPEQEDKLDLPKPPPETVMEVPAVIDRPFDVDECPCTIVSEFRLLNAEDMPDYGVSLTEVQKILELSVTQQPETGYSIGQLQDVANEVRNYYREKGLILAQVVVPVQTVEGGVVDLELFVGTLGRVLTEGNLAYSSAVLNDVFGDLVGKPINKADVEAALLRLTDFPGLTVFGVFQPGLKVGTADIVLKVQDESRFDVAMRVDNHGTKETGKNRFRTIIDWNNPTGGADRLSLSVQQTYQPKLNVFKAVDYERYMWGGKYLFKAFFNTNKFDIGGEFKANRIHSDTENIGVSMQRSFIRSRVENLSMDVGFTKKKADTTTAGQPTNEDRLAVFTLGLDYDSVDTYNPFAQFLLEEQATGGGINFASLEFSRGLNDFVASMGSHADAQAKLNGFRPSRSSGVDQRFASGQFSKLFGSYTRLQTVSRQISLLFRSEFQWSDDLLVPLEQYSIGGPDQVRAFPVAQVLADRALFYSVELLFNAPFIAEKQAFGNRTWGELLQLGLFYDFAVGRLNEPTAADDKTWENYKGLGLGLRFNIPGSIESRVFWAWEVGGEELGEEETTPGEKEDQNRPQIWGDFTYSF